MKIIYGHGHKQTGGFTGEVEIGHKAMIGMLRKDDYELPLVTYDYRLPVKLRGELYPLESEEELQVGFLDDVVDILAPSICLKNPVASAQQFISGHQFGFTDHLLPYNQVVSLHAATCVV